MKSISPMKTKQEIYKARPTSPHLSIYKMQISSVMSIFHRITGVMLFGALSILTWWLILWVFNKFDQSYVELVKSCWVIQFALYAVSIGFFYHLCNGIRHLMWDAGYGFSIKALYKTGWTAIGLAIILTIFFWVCVL
ncbi:MAG: succinate dehydrogenase, cytochrome b556 subunit [Pseudomonadota bacterium]